MADANVRDLIDNVEIPENFDEWVRSKVYTSLSEMPKDMRRAQKISFIMGMMPKGMDWTREQVAEFVDRRAG